MKEASDIIISVNAMMGSYLKQAYLFGNDPTFVDIVAYAFLKEQKLLIPDCHAVII